MRGSQSAPRLGPTSRRKTQRGVTPSSRKRRKPLRESQWKNPKIGAARNTSHSVNALRRWSQIIVLR